MISTSRAGSCSILWETRSRPEDRERDEELLGDLRLGPGLGWNEWSIWNIEWPMEPPPATPGRLMVKPEVAFKMLENLAEGLPPFRPDLGKGGCSWFTTEGAPHVGIDATKNIPVEVQLTKGADWMVLREPELPAVLPAVYDRGAG